MRMEDEREVSRAATRAAPAAGTRPTWLGAARATVAAAAALWAVAGRTAGELRAALGAVPGVLQIQPFGNLVHVRAEADRFGSPGAFTALLAARGLGDPQVEAAEPTLEDVFLEVVRRPAAPPAPERAA